MKHRMCAMVMDENGRSYTSHTDVPMKKVGDLEYISEKQDGSYWGLSFNQNTPLTNEYEMHLTNQPRTVGVMSGHAEIMQQDGSVCRLNKEHISAAASRRERNISERVGSLIGGGWYAFVHGDGAG